ncbi:MAG: XRE family transcriptional regulator [Pseudonocardiales bacterium]|nr:MAG: XRE family transcriptional regulator [Pseudonocardiales bacterium]
MKWNLRWAAARQDIWRPSDLLTAFTEIGFTPSSSKVAALWSGKPITVRLDDLDMICAALHCTVADLMEAEPVAASDDVANEQVAASGQGRGGRSDASGPVPRSGGKGRRSLPPN